MPGKNTKYSPAWEQMPEFNGWLAPSKLADELKSKWSRFLPFDQGAKEHSTGN